MPLALTEMVWDRDLRPQGGAVGLQFGKQSRFALTGIYATGSHVFEDESVMYGGGAELKLATGQQSSFQVLGSYLQFEDLDRLDPAIRRQNTRVGGRYVNDYRVVDVVGRLSSNGQVPMSLVADYCWNTAMDSGNRGLWLAVVLGSTDASRARAEYTYAKIDRDAVVAAFNTDDFFWGTGWEGHRADIATSATKRSSVHAIAQWQRFKDSPDPVTQQSWVTRYRLEVRTDVLSATARRGRYLAGRPRRPRRPARPASAPGCSASISSYGMRAETSTLLASVATVIADASCCSSGFCCACRLTSATPPRTRSARLLAAASSAASPVTASETCGSRSPVTTRLRSDGRVMDAPLPPGPGTVDGRLASRLWSPTIQNVEPGRTFSMSASRAVFRRSGASPRVRLDDRRLHLGLRPEQQRALVEEGDGAGAASRPP